MVGLNQRTIPASHRARTANDRVGHQDQPIYTADDVAGLELEPPGEYPSRAGPTRRCTAAGLTIRQYAGFGSAEETTASAYLLDRGQTGISIAFDLPTELGYHSDARLRPATSATRAIDSIEDMRIVLRGLPLERVSTSMTMEAPAALLLVLYEPWPSRAWLARSSAARCRTTPQGVHRRR